MLDWLKCWPQNLLWFGPLYLGAVWFLGRFMQVGRGE